VSFMSAGKQQRRILETDGGWHPIFKKSLSKKMEIAGVGSGR
jgi:hypothetical protein